MSSRHRKRFSPEKNELKITARKILSATVEDVVSGLNPFGPNTDPAKSVITNPNKPTQFYDVGKQPMFSPIDDITMDECIKYPEPTNRRAKKYTPSDCMKIMKYIDKTEKAIDKKTKRKNGICYRFLTKKSCIENAAMESGIEDPNDYGESTKDLSIQLEGLEREERKTKQNESARAKSKKSPRTRIRQTLKRMFGRNKEDKYNAGRRKFHK